MSAAAAGVHSVSEEPHPSAFDPGLIVSDDSFFNAEAMTRDEVQTFLESQPCRPRDAVPCLSDYREDTGSHPPQGPGHCGAYQGKRNESAAAIITRVADVCGVSPRTLLVLIQKEQSLLTRPSEYGYARATGYGCPDTADCDAKYFGFFNQVYNAAWQFRQYTQHPDRRFEIGSVEIGFHPKAECGASVVRIRNQATANLYNYTPYQPNNAVLAHADAVGDDCSTWGNLNFWRLWHRWFGDPLAERFPAFFARCENLAAGQACAIRSAWPDLTMERQ